MTFAVRMIGWSKSGFVWRPTISSDVTNWVLKTQAIAAGWDGVVPLDAEVTVGSGIVLSANSTSVYGFDTGSGFPAGTSLKLIMPGYVCGMGGAGGAEVTAGSNGGPALRAQYAIGIDAAGGVIGGGGGGGGGSSRGGGGGGGGRTGRTNSAGGGGPSPGAAGTFASGGNGGNGGGLGGTNGQGGDGGSSSGGGGGGWGASGGTAGSYAGGTGGAAVVGNSYITWINTGTRYGSIT